jgi:anti-sigma28 factor (negative regulator of flagellin synthesis)
MRIVPTVIPTVTVTGEPEAAQAVDTDPAVSARINTVRAELEAGTYVVDLDKLSQRIFIDEIDRSS